MTDSGDQFPRYYVQGETVRGEPRIYWVVDRGQNHQTVSKLTRDRRQAQADESEEDFWQGKLEEVHTISIDAP